MKSKKKPSKYWFQNINGDFKTFILLFVAMIILVVYFTNGQTQQFIHLITSRPSPTPSVKKDSQQQIVTLKPEVTLSSGWKKYTVPSHCYSFALPPKLIPVITVWAQGGPLCEGRIVTVALDPSTSILISTFLGGKSLPSDQYITEEHIFVANDPYIITKIWIRGQTAPIEIRADPSNERSLYQLPSVDLFSFDKDKHAPKEIDTATLDLFSKILTTVTIPTQAP